MDNDPAEPIIEVERCSKCQGVLFHGESICRQCGLPKPARTIKLAEPVAPVAQLLPSRCVDCGVQLGTTGEGLVCVACFTKRELKSYHQAGSTNVIVGVVIAVALFGVSASTHPSWRHAALYSLLTYSPVWAVFVVRGVAQLFAKRLPAPAIARSWIWSVVAALATWASILVCVGAIGFIRQSSKTATIEYLQSVTTVRQTLSNEDKRMTSAMAADQLDVNDSTAQAIRKLEAVSRAANSLRLALITAKNSIGTLALTGVDPEALKIAAKYQTMYEDHASIIGDYATLFADAADTLRRDTQISVAATVHAIFGDAEEAAPGPQLLHLQKRSVALRPRFLLSLEHQKEVSTMWQTILARYN